MNRWPAMRLVLFSVLCVFAIAGCATARTGDKMEALRKAVDGYNHAFRWKNYEVASGYIPSDLRAQFVSTHEDDEASLHVEEYTVLRVDFETEDAAEVLVRYRFTLLPSVVVQTRKLTQHWHHVAGHWTLETEDDSIRPLKNGEDAPKVEDSDVDAFGGRDADSP